MSKVLLLRASLVEVAVFATWLIAIDYRSHNGQSLKNIAICQWLLQRYKATKLQSYKATKLQSLLWERQPVAINNINQPQKHPFSQELLAEATGSC